MNKTWLVGIHEYKRHVFNRRFAFILHDIKNLVSQLSLLSRNAERHADNEEFRSDMIATLKSSVGKMNELLPGVDLVPPGLLVVPGQRLELLVGLLPSDPFQPLRVAQVAHAAREFWQEGVRDILDQRVLEDEFSLTGKG